MRAAVPNGYSRAMMIAARPKAMNSTPAQKSLGLRMNDIELLPRRIARRVLGRYRSCEVPVAAAIDYCASHCVPKAYCLAGALASVLRRPP